MQLQKIFLYFSFIFSFIIQKHHINIIILFILTDLIKPKIKAPLEQEEVTIDKVGQPQ